jgi:hypothetical protein
MFLARPVPTGQDGHTLTVNLKLRFRVAVDPQLRLDVIDLVAAQRSEASVRPRPAAKGAEWGLSALREATE